VPIADIEAKLKQQTPIKSVRIARQLFPPELQIYLQERQPVATAIARGKLGFLDEEGVFIPKSFYPQAQKTLPPSPLRVLGAEGLKPQLWRSLLPLIRQSSVKIETLDWRDPSNLSINTEIGRVLLGGNPNTLIEQFKLVSQLRSLTSQVPRARIASIDLSNPATPLLKLKPLPKPIPSPSPSSAQMSSNPDN
jgi:cell division protein FtsQ